MWCAVLSRNAEAPQYGVVFVSLHQDIHNADWVVHEVGPDLFAPESIQVASDLGCDLTSGSLGTNRGHVAAQGIDSYDRHTCDACRCADMSTGGLAAKR